MWTKLKIEINPTLVNSYKRIKPQITMQQQILMNYQLINKIYISHTETFDSEHFAPSERDINVFIPR
jgi:hypothetical protein